MFKRIFGLILIFASISVFCSQDLNYQVNYVEEKYDIDIGESIRNSINNVLGCDVFEMLDDIFQDIEIMEDK